VNREHALRSRRPLPAAAAGVWRWRGCAVMGVLNVTPDSFSDGGRYAEPAVARAAARDLWRAGADVIDVGGVSTRPGAPPVAPDVEAARVIDVIRALRCDEPQARISVDTSDAGVAREAVLAGANLVNDVRGLRDPALRATCAELGVPAVIGHLRGEPATMNDGVAFADVVAQVAAELADAYAVALADGVVAALLDPGIGFGKGDAENRALLRATAQLARAGVPIVIGASRKRTLGAVVGERDPAARDPASIAVALHVARAGAAMVRVHDVAGHVQALRMEAWLHG
jgi:dihydropteroate synthase